MRICGADRHDGADFFQSKMLSVRGKIKNIGAEKRSRNCSMKIPAWEHVHLLEITLQSSVDRLLFEKKDAGLFMPCEGGANGKKIQIPAL
jgi:hypothetical protein